MSQEPVWLKPEQVEALRDAAHSDSFQQWGRKRNDVLVALLADTGLRVGEATALKVEMFEDGYEYVILPPDIQKTYQRNSPGIIRMELGKLVSDLPRSIKDYLDSRQTDSPYLFASQKREKMTTEGVRYTVKKLAREADVRPYNPDGTQTEPDRLHPHAFRHSVAYRMLNYESDYSTDDVKRRLRHGRIQTTEDTYSHFLTV